MSSLIFTIRHQSLLLQSLVLLLVWGGFSPIYAEQAKTVEITVLDSKMDSAREALTLSAVGEERDDQRAAIVFAIEKLGLLEKQIDAEESLNDSELKKYSQRIHELVDSCTK